MLYVLTRDDNSHVVDWIYSNDIPQWTHPEGFTLRKAPDFVPDPGVEPSDYMYVDGEYVIDEEGIREREETEPLSVVEVLSAIFQASPEIVESIPDEAMSKMAPFMPEWQADAHYSRGDICSYNSRTWRCLADHDAQEAWTPSDAPSLWARILASSDPDAPLPWEQPDSTNPYMKGDRVTFEGKVYESLIDNNIWSPSAYPAGWKEIQI